MVSGNIAYALKEDVIQEIEVVESPLKFCSVTLSDVISRGKRLEASVFDVEAKAVSYTVKVTLVNEDGVAVTEALGAANTLEPKFMKGGMGSQNLVVSQAVKRATVSAVKNLIC